MERTGERVNLALERAQPFDKQSEAMIYDLFDSMNESWNIDACHLHIARGQGPPPENLPF